MSAVYVGLLFKIQHHFCVSVQIKYIDLSGPNSQGCVISSFGTQRRHTLLASAVTLFSQISPYPGLCSYAKLPNLQSFTKYQFLYIFAPSPLSLLNNICYFLVSLRAYIAMDISIDIVSVLVGKHCYFVYLYTCNFYLLLN